MKQREEKKYCEVTIEGLKTFNLFSFNFLFLNQINNHKSLFSLIKLKKLFNKIHMSKVFRNCL